MSGRMKMTIRPRRRIRLRERITFRVAASVLSVLVISGIVLFFEFAEIKKSYGTSVISLVQCRGLDGGTTSSSSLAFTSNNTSGNLIVIAIRVGIPVSVPGVTDTRGNTYTLAKSQNMSGDGTGYVYYAKNIAAGANTVTITLSSNATLRFAIHEYCGISITNPFHLVNSAQGTSTAPNSGNVVISSNDELIFGFSFVSNAETFTAGSGFTARAAVSSKLQTEDKFVGSGTYSGSSTINASDLWGSIVATFYATGGAFPIKLIYFTPKLNGSQVDLFWATAAEINNEYFTVERSTDGKHFEEILKEPGAGNSTETLYYSATDYKPVQGISYYRLMQTDYDGHQTYSNIETLENEGSKDEFEFKSVAPNLFTECFKLNFRINVATIVDLMIINISGQVVYSSKIQTREGYNDYEFTEGHRLSAGIYFVSLIYSDQKVTKKIVKE